MNKENNKGKIIIYKTKDDEYALDVKLEKETVWLTLNQIASLFYVDKSGVSRHIKNILKDGELSELGTVAKFATVQKEGNRSISRNVEFYNLDMIISVGYRVNSKRATKFRIWATKILKSHVLKGFTINQSRLKETGLDEFEKAVGYIKRIVDGKQLKSNETKGLLKIITDYANTWVLLQKYDNASLDMQKTTKPKILFSYTEAVSSITELKHNLVSKKEATDIFGREREHGLDGIIGNINQTFAGKDLYPSIEAKASHLLYFIIKDHPFTDGNKRIGSFVFILYLARNNYLFNKKGERKFNENTLVALALLIAESDPKEKELMIKLVMNLMFG